MDQALTHLPALVAEQDAADRATRGVPVPFHSIRWPQSPEAQAEPERSLVRLKDPAGRLLGVGRIQPEEMAGRWIAIEKILIDVNEEGAR